MGLGIYLAVYPDFLVLLPIDLLAVVFANLQKPEIFTYKFVTK
jgi:hypothetical protein